jgi:CDP-diacylglycerol--serine O-phosphatidyltransferase
MSSIDPTASATRFIERTEIGASARPEKVGRASSLAPDVLTSLGLFAGCVSLVSSTGGHFERAAVMIGVSILCDVADGLVALLQNASSAFGLEYDSLADVITFGVAPAILVDSWALGPLGFWAVVAVALYIICSTLRLARFNIQAGTAAGKHRFIGLPVPGAAAAIGGTLFGYGYFGLNSPRVLCVIMTAILAGLSALMVSRVPYPSIKGMDPRSLLSRSVLSGLVIVAALFVVAPRLSGFVAGIAYLLSGLILSAMGERVEAAGNTMPLD